MVWAMLAPIAPPKDLAKLKKEVAKIVELSDLGAFNCADIIPVCKRTPIEIPGRIKSPILSALLEFWFNKVKVPNPTDPATPPKIANGLMCLVDFIKIPVEILPTMMEIKIGSKCRPVCIASALFTIWKYVDK
ncbi:hypothetical protein WICPIJ_009384 [Wickerhamomyces pijperi]|uniref:Uncharacterized protein n=1 Tax=Wickerhamomyces pijperi TaxID=599730 RepID=A0A9P8PMF8_WICPI|nr:hypothetical protein WICPIJ_009384 [Wickerhamomyces pijperi]